MKPFTKIFKKIEQFSTIVIFRHVAPDYDALGSQMGLATFLKENYPNKKIYAVGNNHGYFTHKLFPETDVVEDEELFAKPFLAIVLDTGNKERVEDQRFLQAKYIIKIDHHPTDEPYGDINLVLTEYSATAEILGEMLFSKTFKHLSVSKEAARYLYTGLVGDNGRFQYSSVRKNTFEVAGNLVSTGLDFVKDVYTPMYARKLSDLKVTGYLLNHFTVTPKGVGYYHISASDMEELGITLEKCKEHVNLLANIEEIQIWVSFYEDIEKNLWRASIRSRTIAVNEVASQFHGGGHKNASGATAYSREETLELINALDQLL